MAEEERGWGRVVQVDEEISFTRRGTKTTDTVAFDIEEHGTKEDDKKEDDTESDDTDDEEEVSFTRKGATTAARSDAGAASSTRTCIEATVTSRGGFTELGMKGLLLQLLKDKEELLKSTQKLGKDKGRLLKRSKKLAKEKDELVKKIQKRLEVDRTKKVQTNARVSLRSEEPVENVAFGDQQTDEESTMGDFGASDKDEGEAGDNNNMSVKGQGSREISLLQGGGEEEAVDDVEEEIDLQDEMHCNSSTICHQDLGEQANFSSSRNVAAQPLLPREMSEYEKIRAANVKQREELERQLKRDWLGFKECEVHVKGGGSRKKGAKKLKVVGKEAVNTRSRRPVEKVPIEDRQRGKSRKKRDLGTSGRGLDNEHTCAFLSSIKM